MTTSIDKILEHAGILGMRWGQRKDRKGGASKKGSDKPKKPELKVSDDHAKMLAIRKKKLSELSNAEIQFVNNRLNMQIQYKQLTTSKWDNRKKAAGSLVGKALLNVGKEVWKEKVKSAGGTSAALSQILSTVPKVH